VVAQQQLYTPRMTNHLRKAFLFTLFCALLSWTPAVLKASEGYSFKVKNTTENKITKLLASEDGKTYGNFDIGKGIKPGQTITLVWDKSTEGEDCEQWFKAVFDDGEESEAVKFDFCEDDLTLEF
jgi:hypothetical protein